MKEQYDFFCMGQRCAKDYLTDLRKMTKEIGEKYGVDARIQFEAGIAMVIPVFSEQNVITKSDIDYTTTDFGVDNTRNNSYFGQIGTGKQYLSNGKYNNIPKRK